MNKKMAVDRIKLIRSTTMESYSQFVKYFWPCVSEEKLCWNWHMEYMCNETQRIYERVFKGLPKEYDEVTNISPGTSKSTVKSVMPCAWAWTRMPHFKMIGASYAEEVAIDLSMKCRGLVTHDRFREIFPEIVLRDDMNSKGKFGNTKGGWRLAAGVKGRIMGHHAHVIVVDDPLSPEQGESELDTATANRWISKTLSTRKIDKAVTPMILVMQRIHHNDPTALFLKKKRVRHTCIPAEIMDGKIMVHPDHLRKHYVDGLMDPVRLSREVLDDYKAEGDRFYSTQFLQMPAPDGGEMFKVDRLIKLTEYPKKFDKLVRFWDKAGTKGGGAYTVGTLMGMVEDKQTRSARYFVLDVVRRQVDSYFREKLIEDTAHSDGRSVIVGVEQEPGSGGLESAQNTVGRLGPQRFVVKVSKVDVSTGGKIQRADPFSSQVNGGTVYYLPDKPWNDAWLEELEHFPHSRTKDQVDSASGAFALLAKKRRQVGGVRMNRSRVSSFAARVVPQYAPA